MFWYLISLSIAVVGLGVSLLTRRAAKLNVLQALQYE